MLLKLVEALRGAVPQPIFLVQHMPPTFTALLAERLSSSGERPCAEAPDGERLVPGRCYVAPVWLVSGWVASPRPFTAARARPTRC